MRNENVSSSSKAESERQDADGRAGTKRGAPRGPSPHTGKPALLPAVLICELGTMTLHTPRPPCGVTVRTDTLVRHLDRLPGDHHGIGRPSMFTLL